MLNLVELAGTSAYVEVGNQVYFIAALFPLLVYAVLSKHQSSSKIASTSAESSARGKVVLITGADTGFGSLASVCLTKLGYSVFASCLNAENANSSGLFAELKRQFPETFHVVQLDVTKPEQIEAAFNSVSEWLKEHPDYHFHAVINNAGITYPLVPLELCSMASFTNVMDINFFGAIRVLKTFLPLLRGHKGGRIIFMASLAGELTCPMMSAYCASKWALLAVSDTLRYELGQFGISVTAILPDLYRTQLVLNKSLLYSSLDRELSQMNGDVLNAYGGDHGVTMMRKFIEAMEENANPNLSPVINTIIEAVSSKSPQRRYYPISWKSHIVTSLARWFPSLLDNMVSIGQSMAIKSAKK